MKIHTTSTTSTILPNDTDSIFPFFIEKSSSNAWLWMGYLSHTAIHSTWIKRGVCSECACVCACARVWRVVVGADAVTVCGVGGVR